MITLYKAPTAQKILTPKQEPPQKYRLGSICNIKLLADCYIPLDSI